MTKTKLAVLISGNGSNLQAIIDAIHNQVLDAEIAVVISNRANAYGLERAQAAAIPTHVHKLKPYRQADRNRRDYDADLAVILQQYEPDWVVLAGWMHILSSAFLDHFPNHVINLHPALPGQFPGAQAIEDAFTAYQRGEIDESGIMVHLVPDEQVDAGPVLATQQVPIYAEDTLETVKGRFHKAEHTLLVTTLALLHLDT